MKASPFEKIDDLKSFATVEPERIEREIGRLLTGDSESNWSWERIPRARLWEGSEGQGGVRTQVAEEFVGRDEAVEAVLASLISGVPMVMLGPPGTGKSAIVRRIASCCGLDAQHEHRGYFEYLINAHTMPENLFGPPNIRALQADEPKFERLTRNYLPEAEIAFLDEVFRGGSHILNTLLTLINERIFYNGHKAQAVPLIGVVGAANDPPGDSDLRAFYDRFPIRVWMHSVFDEYDEHKDPDFSTGSELLNRSIWLDQNRHQTRSAVESLGAKPLACVNDFRAAAGAVLRFTRQEWGGSRSRRDTFERLFHQLRTDCDLSDRTYYSLWKFAAALAWLRGNPDSDRSHIEVFRYVAPTSADLGFVWSRVDQALGMQHDGED